LPRAMARSSVVGTGSEGGVMRIVTKGLAGACGAAVAALALSPALAQAEITSIVPDQGGSGGNELVVIHGTFGTPLEEVHFGGQGTKIVTGTPTKGQCKSKSTTEIECRTPFHEYGSATVEVKAGGQLSTFGFTYTAEFFKNEVAVGTGAQIPVFGEGAITFETPEVEVEPGHKAREIEMECVNLFYGSVVNEGSPPTAHLQTVEWWAMGHVPSAEHPEMSDLCRFSYLGATAGEAWVTAERPLNIVEQVGEICISQKKRELSECPKKAGEPGAERVITSVARSITREPLTTPWNEQVVGVPREPHVKIGIPTETGKSCTENPAPPGCIRLTIIYPGLDLQIPFEGSLEPRWLNGVGNGLSPAAMEFEGEASGHLHIANEEKPILTSGIVKLLGAPGRELINVK
jgi:hypothetical protein